MSFNKCTLASVGFSVFIWCKLNRLTGSNEKFWMEIKAGFPKIILISSQINWEKNGWFDDYCL